MNKPLTVHTEAAFIDEVWEEIQKKVKKNEVYKWYLMTPANYDYFKGSFQTLLTKEEISNILKERYLWLKEKKQKIEIHIHLDLLASMKYQRQKEIIKESLRWFEKELGLRPKEVVFGWWMFNKDSERICKEMGLKIRKQNDFKSLHDYNWIGKIYDNE